MSGAFLLQAVHQLLPHLNDAVSHTMHLLQPKIIEKNKIAKQTNKIGQ